MSFEGCHLFFFVVFAFEMNIKAEAFSGGCLASAMARLVVPENDSQVPPGGNSAVLGVSVALDAWSLPKSKQDDAGTCFHLG